MIFYIYLIRMELIISISQISILTGHNIYQSQRDYFN